MELQIKGVSKNYGKCNALKNVNLSIGNGMFGLLGPNGAGKTTLMRTITTLLPIQEGTIAYGDIDWKNGEKVRKIIGYLPQHFSMYKRLKVEEALEHMAIMKGVENVKEQVDYVIRKLNLEPDREKKIQELSGGMIRRVGIAQAILGNPRILVVDEPTAGLDPENRIQFRNMLKDISKDKIVIISTHIIEDIEATCDKLAILEKGKILFTGSMIDILKKAQDKVFEIQVPKEEVDEISGKVKIISLKTLSGGYKVRFLIKEQNPFIPKGAIKISPTLEEAYLYITGRSIDE